MTGTETSLGPLEEQVLEIVWSHHPVTVQTVMQQLRAQGGRKLAYTTVMTVLCRLVEKGTLRRGKNGRSYLYSPATTKLQFLRRLAQVTLQSFADRFGEEAVAAFAQEASSLSSSQKKQLSQKLRR